MSRFVAVGLTVLLLASTASAETATAADEKPAATEKKAKPTPVGRWTTIDDETHKPKSVVEIWEENGKLYGKIVKLFRKPDEDQNPKCTECEGKLKNQPIIGMTILRGLVKDDNEWTDGTITDPKNGKTYDCTISLEDGGKKLKVRGYMGISLLGRTQHWVRAE